MSKVRMYCTATCPYCQMALRLLDRKGVEVEKIRVDLEPGLREEMTRLTGKTSVPQIYVGDTLVGGYSDLAELDMEGELDELLAG
jgi:glutaredoxin 3